MIVCTVQTKSRVVDERKTITGCIHGVDCRYEDILLTYKKKSNYRSVVLPLVREPVQVAQMRNGNKIHTKKRPDGIT